MPASRPIVPSLMASFGDGVLVVDRAQPTAALLDEGGEVLSTVSWTDVLEPAETAAWPTRHLAVSGRDAWIEERSEGTAVTVGADGRRAADGRSRIDHEAVRTDRTDTDRRRPRAHRRWAPLALGQRAGRVLAAGTGQVSRRRHGRRGRRRLGRRGGRCRYDDARRHQGGSPAPVVFRSPAPTRPPRHRGRPVFDVALPVLTAALWSDVARPFPPDELAHHLTYTLAECGVLREVGADDIAFTVTDPTRRPVIMTTFRMSPHPTTFCRVDELVDEVGRRTGGLVGAGVFLAEDLSSGLVEGIVEHARGPAV